MTDTTTPGAGEGERWEAHYNPDVGWCIYDGPESTDLVFTIFSRSWRNGESLEQKMVRDKALAHLIVKLHNHPWVPDLLIDHDAPVCEIYGEGMAAHTEESLLFQDYMRLHDEREADQQTIANLETVVHAYKRAAENAEQTIRELRKALKQVVNAGYGEGVTRQWAYDKACKALAATKEEKSS